MASSARLSSGIETQDRLDLQIFFHALGAIFPTVAGLLVPTKGRIGVPRRIIEMHLSGSDLLRHYSHSLKVRPLNMGSQTVDRIVCDLYRLFERIVRNNGQDGSEDFLLGNLHFRIYV